MEEYIGEKGLKHLEQIEQKLEEIKERMPASGQAFAYGLLQGAGALLGGIFTLTLLGWALSIFGVIPGFADISHYFKNIVDNFHR